MNKKRSKLEIVYDILRVIRDRNGRIKPTHILYKSNLSYQMMEEYLTELIGKGFIMEIVNKKDGKKTYAITEKGLNYLNKYRVITDFVGSFGLE
jgi:predicted transcriptional regulator